MTLHGQELVNKSLEIATKVHEGQFRADKKTPYIVHPIDVSRRFLKNYRDGGYRMLKAEDEYRGQALGNVHDCVEDGELTIEQISDMGMESIVNELVLLTKFVEGTYLDYLLRLKRSQNHLAIQVKIADMESNLNDLENIPSAAARKGLKIKYELARYIILN